jgi:hypothetical protein
MGIGHDGGFLGTAIDVGMRAVVFARDGTLTMIVSRNLLTSTILVWAVVPTLVFTGVGL